uniref:Uncharacterized protein n=1 Tax=Oryza barthii TaxID=65489 RepID=A0A0D3EJ72_9ORYZ
MTGLYRLSQGHKRPYGNTYEDKRHGWRFRRGGEEQSPAGKAGDFAGCCCGGLDRKGGILEAVRGIRSNSEGGKLQFFQLLPSACVEWSHLAFSASGIQYPQCKRGQ